ncbi:MAG: serine/threonine protein kinase [Symploca sp. SIO3E6]|nr:serine/threonine protein kinase [Caldora sp. SIO3E6]
MEIYCTRPGCSRPENFFADLDDKMTLQTAQQKFCTACGMPLILAGRYLPSKLLGQGGFGAAFLARDRYTPTMRECVVKQFQPSGNLSPQQLKIAQNLFAREAEVLEQLGRRHSQIPDLFAFFPLSIQSQKPGEEDQFFYLVQEFIDGQNLEEELADKVVFTEAEALEVLREILNVLKFVHENNSIHRDIKPSNIMRERTGRLYLLDFGAVKQQVNQGAVTSTGSSTGIYSMGFAPPEQMSGAQVYPSTDLYALAVTVITLLTGKEPGDLYDSYNNQWTWRIYAQVSDTLEAVLNRMLLPTPNQRFSSAQEVMDALEAQSPPPPPPVTPTTSSSSPTFINPPQPTSQPPINPPQPTSQPPINPPQPIPQPTPPVSAKKAAFSLMEILGGAAFTGFTGGLLSFALRSFLGLSGISFGLLGMIIGGLVYAQYRRLIEGKDLPIFAGIALLLMFIPFLRAGFPFLYVMVVAILAGAAAVAITTIFRLVYLLLSRFL